MKLARERRSHKNSQQFIIPANFWMIVARGFSHAQCKLLLRSLRNIQKIVTEIVSRLEYFSQAIARNTYAPDLLKAHCYSASRARSHFQGYRLSFSKQVSRSINEFGTPTQAFRVKIKTPKFRRDKVRIISEEALKLAVEQKKHEDEKWEEEEMNLMESYND